MHINRQDIVDMMSTLPFAGTAPILKEYPNQAGHLNPQEISDTYLKESKEDLTAIIRWLKACSLAQLKQDITQDYQHLRTRTVKGVLIAETELKLTVLLSKGLIQA